MAELCLLGPDVAFRFNRRLEVKRDSFHDADAIRFQTPNLSRIVRKQAYALRSQMLKHRRAQSVGPVVG